MDITELKQFLIESNKPHAEGTAKVTTEEDKSHTIAFAKGDWKMHDNFFGGEPYGGRQVIFLKNVPVWVCVYYGAVHDTSLSPDKVYDFLREALQHPIPDQPFRGPETYKKGSLEYNNKVKGDVTEYSGREVILENGKQIYWAEYLGGLVDQRAQGEF